MSSRVGTSGAGAVNTGTFNTLPAGVATGDNLVLFVISDSSALLTATMAGWTRTTQAGPLAGLYGAVFRRTTTAAETGNIALTGLTNGTKGVSWIDVHRASSGATLSVDAQFAGDADSSSTAVLMTGAAWALAVGDVVDCAAYLYAASAFSGNLGSPVLAAGVAATVTARFGGRTTAAGVANAAAYAAQDAVATAAGSGAPSFSATSAGANGQGLAIFAKISEAVLVTSVSATLNGSPARIARSDGSGGESFSLVVSVQNPPAGGTWSYSMKVERCALADFSTGVTVVQDGTTYQASPNFTWTPDRVAFWRFTPAAKQV